MNLHKHYPQDTKKYRVLFVLACLVIGCLGLNKNVERNVPLPILSLNSKNQSSDPSQVVQIDSNGDPNFPIILTGEYEFGKEIVVPVVSKELNQISIVIGRLLRNFSRSSNSNQHSKEQLIPQQQCEFVPRHMEIQNVMRISDNDPQVQVALEEGEMSKSIVSDGQGIIYILTNNSHVHIHKMEISKEIYRRQDKDNRQPIQVNPSTNEQRKREKVSKSLILVKQAQLKFSGHALKNILYFFKHSLLIAYNSHNVYFIEKSSGIHSILKLEENKQSIKSMILANDLAFIIDGNNHLRIYWIAASEQKIKNRNIEFVLVKEISQFGGQSLQIVDLLYDSDRKTLWLLDYEFGIYQYHLSESSNSTQSALIVQESHSYHIPHGRKLFIHRLKNNIFEVIFEVKKKEYVLQLWYNGQQMLINRFYHETKEPQKLLKIDDYYMVVVGKRLVSTVRYGINAGIWGYMKWIQQSSNNTQHPRHLQGLDQSSYPQQLMDYNFFATRNSRQYPAISSKSVIIVDYPFIMNNLSHDTSNYTIKFIVGYTDTKVFFKQLIEHSAKIVCKFNQKTRQNSQEEQPSPVQTLSYVSNLQLQYISPYSNKRNQSESEKKNILNYQQNVYPQLIQINITLVDPEFKRNQLFYFYLDRGIQILGSIFFFFIGVLVCVYYTRVKRQKTITKLNEDLDQMMKGIAMGAHKKSIIYGSVSQENRQI